VKAFRDTWKLGIHSYLAYLRDRLVAARVLLTETGSVFVQMGDENVHLVRSVLDEVFGSENFITTINLKKKANQKGDLLESITDYILFYAKDKNRIKFRPLFLDKEDGGDSEFSADLTGGGVFRTQIFPFNFEGHEFLPGAGNSWKTSFDGMRRLATAGRIKRSKNQIRYRRLMSDFGRSSLTNNWDDTGGAADRIYVVQTATKVVQRCLLMTTDPGDLVLDPTCGSGTTAYVAEQWGRRWITLDSSRVAMALARTRLMAAEYPYYLLADSPEGVKKEAELTGNLPPEYKTECDIKKGFVYERVPHVTLKSIANNPEIKEGMTREQIDAAIARHADTETLVDQPYKDGKRLRVCGPFTVESLSPHRVLTADEERPATERQAAETTGPGQFETMIIENLRKAGVQNTIRNERLKFERLEPYAGVWVHAAGDYIENGKSKRVAISIGPEHGTVGPDLVKEAAKEAVQGVGFDLLLVCGFAFDPHVSEEAKRYGKLNVLTTRMNPDLSMGDELLKKTGAGNLFMIFGEPDIDIKKTKDGKLTAEIKGLDVYDPTTGQIRSHTTDDIACWFIDTNYNGESFFVRHAYFTGADEPYEKLKRALRAEIDEGAWSALYSTKSRPFDPPKTGKIAVKVINHYGDEVLKVYSL
jgi:adenine-specific DNA-methyltransferase